MTKVKLATRRKINNLSCYEMRLNLGKMGSVRIAFTVHDEQVVVWYLSTSLQKSEFSKELEKSLAYAGYDFRVSFFQFAIASSFDDFPL